MASCSCRSGVRAIYKMPSIANNLNSSLVTTAMITMVLGYPALGTLIAGAGIPYSDDWEAVRAYSKFWREILNPNGFGFLGTVAQSADSP